MENPVRNYSCQDENALTTECLDDHDFGHILRRSRLREGLSLRAVAKRIGLSAHSGVAEYESGRRLPPEDLIATYERALSLPPGYLLDLRRQALRKRADRTMAASQASRGNTLVAASSIELPPVPAHWRSLAKSATIICLVAAIVLLMTRLRCNAKTAVRAEIDEKPTVYFFVV
jgi:transcriptional regulator with XRE-family HTH domain